jgi:hypothetical protein
VALAGPAQAQWTGTVTDLQYTDPTNWVDSKINDTFSGLYGWGDGNFSININSNHTVENNFTWQVEDAATVTSYPNGQTWTFASTQPVFFVDIGGITLNKTLNFGVHNRNFSLQFQPDSALTFTISPSSQAIGNAQGRDIFAMHATMSNVGSLTKNGGGYLSLNRTVTISGSGSGKVEVLAGQLALGYDQSGFGKITGATEYNVVGQGSLLGVLLSNVSVTDTNVLGDAPVNLYSGGLFMGRSNVVDQSVGAVNLYGGRAVISSLNKTLTISALERRNFATLNILSSNNSGTLGFGHFVKISDAQSSQAVLDALVGGGDQVKILPWAAANNSNDNDFLGTENNGAWSGANLVTYTAADGFRALTASEYYTADDSTTFLASGSYDNVSLGGTGVTVDQDLTVNALKLDSNNITHTIAANTTLTVTSGAIVAGGNYVDINGSGILNTGDNPLIITGRATIGVGAGITNSVADDEVGLIAANVGTGVTLSGANTYHGITLAQGGLTISNALALPATTELRVDRGGVVSVNASSKVRKLSGVGTVNASGGLVVGKGDPASGGQLVVSGSGILAPGDISGNYQAGTLLLGATVTDLVFDDGGIFAVDLSADANDLVRATRSGGSGLYVEENALTTLMLNFLGGYTPDAGATWLLTDGFTTSSGATNTDGFLTDMTVSDLLHPNWEYTLLFDNHNLRLTLEAIPEPSTWLLLTLGAALLLTVRRRR